MNDYHSAVCIGGSKRYSACTFFVPIAELESTIEMQRNNLLAKNQLMSACDENQGDSLAASEPMDVLEREVELFHSPSNVVPLMASNLPAEGNVHEDEARREAPICSERKSFSTLYMKRTPQERKELFTLTCLCPPREPHSGIHARPATLWARSCLQANSCPVHTKPGFSFVSCPKCLSGVFLPGTTEQETKCK